MKAQAEWTVRTEVPVASYSAAKRGKLIGIGLSAKHQGQRSYQTALTGRRHDCTRPAKLKHRLNHLAKRAPSRHCDAPASLQHVPVLQRRTDERRGLRLQAASRCLPTRWKGEIIVRQSSRR